MTVLKTKIHTVRLNKTDSRRPLSMKLEICAQKGNLEKAQTQLFKGSTQP